MSFAEQAFFEQHYQTLDDEEIAVLFARSVSNPDSLTEEAQLALNRVISQRNINILTELEQRRIAHNQHQKMANIKLATSQSRNRKISASIGKLIGLVGLSGGVIVLILSIHKMDIGGIFSSLVTLVFSAWLAFRYNGD